MQGTNENHVMTETTSSRAESLSHPVQQVTDSDAQAAFTDLFQVIGNGLNVGGERLITCLRDLGAPDDTNAEESCKTFLLSILPVITRKSNVLCTFIRTYIFTHSGSHVGGPHLQSSDAQASQNDQKINSLVRSLHDANNTLAVLKDLHAQTEKQITQLAPLCDKMSPDLQQSVYQAFEKAQDVENDLENCMKLLSSLQLALPVQTKPDMTASVPVSTASMQETSHLNATLRPAEIFREAQRSNDSDHTTAQLCKRLLG